MKAEIIDTPVISPSELHEKLLDELGYLKYLITELEWVRPKADILNQLEIVNERVNIQYDLMKSQHSYYENFVKLFSPYNSNLVN